MFRAHRLILGLAFAIIAVDQATKAWIRVTIPFESYIGASSIDIIPGYFYFVHVGNWGAAFGKLQGFGWLFIALAIAFLGAIAFFRKFFELHRPYMQFIFGLVTGGIIGNLIDRIWQGYVTDFILNIIPVINYHWPVYNIADAAIVIGISLYGIESVRADLSERKSTKSPKS